MPERTYIALNTLNWSCTRCHQYGMIEYPADIADLDLERKLRGAHHLASPDCHDEFGLGYVSWKICQN